MPKREKPARARRTVPVEVTLDADVWQELHAIAKMAGVTIHQVASVILASHIVQSKKHYAKQQS